MLSRFDADIERLEERIGLLQALSDARLEQVQRRALAGLSSPAALAIAAGGGAVLGLLTSGRHRKSRSLGSRLAGHLFAATGALTTVTRLGHAARTLIAQLVSSPAGAGTVPANPAGVR
jgi:hypothetical protein